MTNKKLTVSKLRAILIARLRCKEKIMPTLTEEERVSQMLFWILPIFGTCATETTHLRFKHIELDLENPRLTIERSEGNKKKMGYIPLLPEQVKQWKEWLSYRTSLNLPHDFVFYNSKTPSKKFMKSALSRLLSEISESTAIKLSASKQLRFAHAAKLWKFAIDIRTLQHLLGHCKGETTIRYLRKPDRRPLKTLVKYCLKFLSLDG